jgi:peroxiredoxin
MVRSTYLIESNHTIRKVFPKVKPGKHAAEVMATLG